MAIRLQFINLVIPITTLERLFAAEGGFRGFILAQGPMIGDTEMVWHDAHLCRVDGAMNWVDLEDMVALWEKHGLQGLVGAESNRRWKDFAICVSHTGPTFPCDWLVYDAADNSVHLAGTPKGEVAGPKPVD